MYLRKFQRMNGLSGAMPLSANDQIAFNQCIARGGVPRTSFRNSLTIPGVSEEYYTGCSYPPAGPAAPAQTNITSNVQTQASPQISPAFVQQDKPTNSPVSTGISAEAAQSANADNAKVFSEYLAQQEARDAEMFKLLQREPVSTPAPVYENSGGGGAPVDPAAPANTLPGYVNKNIAPLAIAAAALISIVAYFRKGK